MVMDDQPPISAAPGAATSIALPRREIYCMGTRRDICRTAHTATPDSDSPILRPLALPAFAIEDWQGGFPVDLGRTAEI